MWNIIGQPKAVDFLRHSLESGRLAHAYLFTGPPHTGKTTLAINLAQALNCESGAAPCGQCRSCLRIAAGNHADVQIIGRSTDSDSGDSGPKKAISIGQIRKLQQTAGLRPYEGRHRVFIIDGAEYMNEESANCLLKTLEEPPPDVLIILVAANDARLMPTIVSRCQQVELLPVPAIVIEDELTGNRGVEPEKAGLLSRLCHGGIGWAIQASQSESMLQERLLRLTELEELETSSLDKRFDFAASLAAKYSKSRESVEEILKLWIDWWRDLLLIKAGCAELITNKDQESILTDHSGQYSLTGIRNFIESVQAAIIQLEQNANARLVLEVLMLSIPVKEEERSKQPSA